MVNWNEHNKGYIDEEKQARKDAQKQRGQFNGAPQPSLSSWDPDAAKVSLAPSELNFDPKNLPILKSPCWHFIHSTGHQAPLIKTCFCFKKRLLLINLSGD